MRQLLAHLNIGYYHPRFRALFALQFYPREEVEAEMKEGSDINPGNRSIIEKYVFSHSVPDFLAKNKRWD